ncbi:MAG: replication-relaxation family protein, partial [Alphaproteobacteria bacterium]|nr:replication-relaxation family protein [Alphaproteobacteria bacterium]
MRITDRDEEILLIVARHRIARSTHIIRLLQNMHPGASEQGLLRRLEWLYHAGYLSGPKVQLYPYRAGAGSAPIAYMLGNHGADLVARKYGFRRATVDWTAKARTAKRGEFEHAIEITDFMVEIDLACRRRGTHEVIYF